MYKTINIRIRTIIFIIITLLIIYLFYDSATFIPAHYITKTRLHEITFAINSHYYKNNNILPKSLLSLEKSDFIVGIPSSLLIDEWNNSISYHRISNNEYIVFSLEALTK